MNDYPYEYVGDGKYKRIEEQVYSSGEKFVPFCLRKEAAKDGKSAFRAALEKKESGVICAALDESAGVVSDASKLLGISERMLWYKINKLGLRDITRVGKREKKLGISIKRSRKAPIFNMTSEQLQEIMAASDGLVVRAAATVAISAENFRRQLRRHNLWHLVQRPKRPQVEPEGCERSLRISVNEDDLRGGPPALLQDDSV